ncbi:DUF475 domain-containing protein [Hydromonas duriensis]|uniref:DUF475 domain-containing protein n=1 Tax=Hydromonas duriensis TaxID=1527608 RepID=A0A4R6Y9B0_9BURK|nr:DUF475 domain-containing protein [Hydromonas duriensis]TDR32018.1 hypothetical protein DFR44_10684 [Hydromonas duriensis]
MKIKNAIKVMLTEFWGAWLISFVALAFAYKIGGVAGFTATLILCLFEISISFDNAVVNAMVLKKQSAAFRTAFLTIGFLIGVVGMRLLLPLLIVSLTTGLAFAEVYQLAVNQPDVYSEHLHAHHTEVMLFGGGFLMMVALTWLFDHERDIHWLGGFERRLSQMGRLSMIAAGVALLLTLIVVFNLPVEKRYAGLLAGVLGVTVYIFIGGIGDVLGSEDSQDAGDMVKKGLAASISTFMFLEVRDASFSFDGVIGAFAISKDIFIIMLGLGVGAQWVRSMTIFFVKRDTLSEYVYLEHGAHWAILALALLMFGSALHEIPESVTGLIGLVLIGWSLVSSVRARNHLKANQAMADKAQ